MSPTWQLPVLEGVICLRTPGPGVTLTAGHYIAGKREMEGKEGWEPSLQEPLLPK